MNDSDYIDKVVAWADTPERRKALLFALSRSVGDRCPEKIVPMLGTMSDGELSYIAGVQRQTVALWRRNRGIRPMEYVKPRRAVRRQHA